MINFLVFVVAVALVLLIGLFSYILVSFIINKVKSICKRIIYHLIEKEDSRDARQRFAELQKKKEV